MLLALAWLLWLYHRPHRIENEETNDDELYCSTCMENGALFEEQRLTGKLYTSFAKIMNS